MTCFFFLELKCPNPKPVQLFHSGNLVEDRKMELSPKSSIEGCYIWLYRSVVNLLVMIIRLSEVFKQLASFRACCNYKV